MPDDPVALVEAAARKAGAGDSAEAASLIRMIDVDAVEAERQSCFRMVGFPVWSQVSGPEGDPTPPAHTTTCSNWARRSSSSRSCKLKVIRNGLSLPRASASLLKNRTRTPATPPSRSRVESHQCSSAVDHWVSSVR